MREGVDDQAVDDLLAPRFSQIEVLSYWSNHLRSSHRMAKVLRLRNTFSVRASGFTG